MPFRTPLDLYEERITALDRRRLLRPLKGGEIIDHAVRLIQLYGSKILPATLLPSALCLLALTSYGVYVGPLFFGSASQKLTEQSVEIIVGAAMFFFLCLPLLILGVSFATNYTCRIAQAYMMGEKVDPDQISAATQGTQLTTSFSVAQVLLRSAFPVILAVVAIVGSGLIAAQDPNNLFFSLIAVGSMTFFGLLALIAPPVVLGNLSLAPVINILEGIPGREATKRSRHLMKAHGHVLGGHANLIGAWILVLFVGLCIWAGFSASIEILGLGGIANHLQAQGRFGPILAEAIRAIPAFLTLWLLVPFYSAIISVLYFDRLVRLEAYDIKVLAKDVLQSDSDRPRA